MLSLNIEALKKFLSQIKDLGQAGFPYLDAAKARTELQLRECIQHIFGEQSPEFQQYQHHKLLLDSPEDTQQSLALVKSFIATLEQRKRDLQEKPVSAPVVAPPSAAAATPPIHKPVAPPTPATPSTPPPARAATTTQIKEPVPAPPQQMMPPLQDMPGQPMTVPAQAPAPIEPSSPTVAAPKQKQEPIQTPQRLTAPSPKTEPPVPKESIVEPTRSDANPIDTVKSLCHRFHSVARQLRLRGEYRATLSVEDELDVQDLLHALLRIHFDDIGTEEWMPSYAEGAPRTTFLLHDNRLAVFVKKTRNGLTAKDITDQLKIDTEHYRANSRCTALLCFIYDPDGRIGNPRGLETNLTTVTGALTVEVLIAPK
ncbi:MAG: hypothetical protein OEV08_15565 [Nitrospira sp.]|nr:hypothetical protein [Nitrospira sp.]